MGPNNQFLIFLAFLNLIWVSLLSFLLFVIFKRYRDLTSGIDQKDFTSILTQIKKHQKTLLDNQQHLNQHHQQLELSLKSHIQKIGFVRYNPFGNTGGDQSFCLSLLDGEDNGILLTSLHARDQTRIYTKEIIAGVSQDKLELSREEAQSIKKAQKWSQRK